MRLACLSLLMLATPALAETDIRQLLIDTARKSDCVLTEEIAKATFPALGLTEDQVGQVAYQMREAGEAELVGNSFRLSPELCTGQKAAPVVPAVSPLMGRVIEVFHQHGCKMDEAAGMTALAAAGITEADLDTLVAETQALISAGLMTRDEATATISIAAPLCSGAEVAADPADPLIRMLRENGCALTQETARAQVAGYGMTMEGLQTMADSLLTRGLAREDSGRLVLEGCTR